MTNAQECTAEPLVSTEIDAQTVTRPQTEGIGYVLSPPESLSVLVDLALVLSGATGVAIAVAEPGEMVCCAGSGALACDTGKRIDVRSGLLGLCFRTGEVLSSVDVKVDERVDRAAAGELGAKSAIAVPLCSGAAILGVLEAVSSELNAFGDCAVCNLKGMAELIAHSISIGGNSNHASLVEMTPRNVATGASRGPFTLRTSPQESGPAVAAINATGNRTRVARLRFLKLVAAAAFPLVLTSGALLRRPWQKSERASNAPLPVLPMTAPAEHSEPTRTAKLSSDDNGEAGRSLERSHNSELVQVRRIQFSSNEGFTEVTVGLNAGVRYEAHHFRNPERIYFDLHSTSLAPALGPWGRTFKIGDKFLLDVRVAQHAVGLTRVVLDTKGALRWSATLVANPPRLIIRVGTRKQDLERGLVAGQLPKISWTGQEPRAALNGANLRNSPMRGPAIVQPRALTTNFKRSNSLARHPAVRAIYLTGVTAGSSRGRELIDSWRRMGGNAIVFDIKNNTGIVTVPFEHPLNDHALPASIDNLSKFVEYLHSSGMYAIGRIAVFRDDRLVTQHPELAVRSRQNGKPWREKGRIVWADPSNSTVQQYNISLAEAAAAAGLDEVQFDYIRFPVEGNQKDAVFSIQRKQARWRRSNVITHFVAQAYSQLHPRRVLLSLDVFGVLAWDHRADVASTGQDLRALVPYCDVLSPMIYPSHFFGMDGYAYPGDAPRHFISEAMKRFSQMTANTRVVVRPWLQGFSWHTSKYSTDYVLTQILTARANGARGFLFWNADNEYREPFAALLQMRSTQSNQASK